jgi:phage N-6-adenine-methyltransferase
MRTLLDTPQVDLHSSLIRQIIQDAQECQSRIRRFQRSGLLAWLEQAERLHMIHNVHNVVGNAFEQIADEIGFDSSTAYGLLQLHPFADRLLKECDQQAAADPKFRYPGWRTGLGMMMSTQSHRAFNVFRNLPDSDNRPTPQKVFDWISQRFGPFDLDVAADDENAKCAKYFTIDQNGLDQKWSGSVWMNPPYSNVLPWVKKAWEYAKAGHGTVTALLPVWTDTGWFSDYVTHGYITLLKRRIRFSKGAETSAPFPNMVVVWQQESARRGNQIMVHLEELPRGE